LLGGVLWGIGVTLLGFALGTLFGSIEGIDSYFTLLVLATFIIPGLPTAWHLWKENKEQILGWVRGLLGSKPASVEASSTKAKEPEA
ncbi:MAG TPA: hypothetical protein VF478_09400, partial [Anaerolineae bacterium]